MVSTLEFPLLRQSPFHGLAHVNEMPRSSVCLNLHVVRPSKNAQSRKVRAVIRGRRHEHNEAYGVCVQCY